MLAEKLLLHVLIIIAPVLILYVVSENRKIGHSPLFIGLVQGIAASLCLIFSFMDLGFMWDLRYIPLVMAFLYGGPRAGIIVLFSILITRFFVGGDLLLFGLISGIVAAIIPFLAMRYFTNITTKKKRIALAIFIGFWPNLVFLSKLVNYFSDRHSLGETTNMIFTLFSLV